MPPNGGPGLAAIHALLDGPSYTVDVPAEPQSQAVDSEIVDAPEADTSSSAQLTQAFSLRESSGSSSRIVTLTGSRPSAYIEPHLIAPSALKTRYSDAPYHHRYASDAPRSTLVLGPQHSFARLWAAFGGFAPSDAAPNMRMARTVEVDRAFVEAYADEAPVMDNDQIGQLIQAVQTKSTVETGNSTPEPVESQAEYGETRTASEDIGEEEPANYIPWSPITSDPTTLVHAASGRVSTHGSQLSKEDHLERRAFLALEKARAAEAAEKARVAELARSTQESKALAAKKAVKENSSKKQGLPRAKRTAPSSAKSAKLQASGAKAQPKAPQLKATPTTTANGDAPKQSAAPAQRQQAGPSEQRKPGILGRLLGW